MNGCAYCLMCESYHSPSWANVGRSVCEPCDDCKEVKQ